ncbi:MAG: guanylate kinase [Clostridia bacterium]|nr:guanylate kinase [Clostridia bacterium]
MANENTGRLLIISGPSGCGKNTVYDALALRDKEIGQTVSATTRKPRDGERDGVDYYFITEEDFLNKINNNEFVEHVHYATNYYGTLRSEIDRVLKLYKKVAMVIEVNGALNIKKMYPEAVSVFLMPPSKEALVERINCRGTMDADELARRMKTAEEEMQKSCEYDYVVVNDVLENAVEEIYNILNL